MAYKEYNYGTYRTEIRDLMRKRLVVLDKIRYHKNKIIEFEQSVVELDKKIQLFLNLTEGKI